MDWKINLLILTYGLWLTQPQKSGVQANGLGSAPRRKNVVKDTVTNEMSSTAGQKKQTPTKPTVKIPDENGQVYYLKSVIKHAGSTITSGHYTTALNMDGKWRNI